MGLRSPNSQKFIVITGIDKCGKTTLFQGLKRFLPDNFRFVSHNQEDVPENMRFLSDLRKNAPLELFNDFPNELRSAYYSTMLYAQAYLIERYLAQGFNVVADSYYFKYLAKEITFGKADAEIAKRWYSLRNPDLVILLELKPEIAWQRSGGKLNSQEYFRSPTRTDFVGFQEELWENLVKLTQFFNLKVIDGSLAPREVLLSAVRLISPESIIKENPEFI